MVGSHPESPDDALTDVQYPETLPAPVIDETDPDAGFEPGTELLPEKGDFHRIKPRN